MLDVVYPGGLAAFTGNNPNLTQISNQLSTFKAAAASYYVTGGTCDLSKKFPYPNYLVDIPAASPTITAAPTATATPYGQCEFIFFSFFFLVLSIFHERYEKLT